VTPLDVPAGTGKNKSARSEHTPRQHKSMEQHSAGCGLASRGPKNPHLQPLHVFLGVLSSNLGWH
jgi:hypothetical protein